MFAHRSLLRLHGFKKVSNGWSGINFHYWGPHQARLVDIKFKTQVTRGVQNIQICIQTPCSSVKLQVEDGTNNCGPLRMSELYKEKSLQTIQVEKNGRIYAKRKCISIKRRFLFEWYSCLFGAVPTFYQMEWVWQWLRLQFGGIGRLGSEESREGTKRKWSAKGKGDFHYSLRSSTSSRLYRRSSITPK